MLAGLLWLQQTWIFFNGGRFVYPMNFDTIAAIATPTGKGGIGIVRISGDRSVPIVSSLYTPYSSAEKKQDSRFLTKANTSVIFKSHTINYGYIIDPVDQAVVDEVLVMPMLAPSSYTKEDVVEIQTHAGTVVLDIILNLLIKQGVRLAEPGEFTKRAFLNGRIDLTQAESVIDIINARTEQELKLATSHISGAMGLVIRDIRDFLLDFMSIIEASIDFPDDVEDTLDIDNLTLDFQRHVFDKINLLIQHYKDSFFLRDGIKAIILGRPNVGKSSIMNCLIGDDRVIVSPLPGTTRDMVSESININGISVTLCDTAGLHDSSDSVENLGIKKTYDNLTDADLVIFLVDSTCSFTDEDRLIFNKIKNKKILLVINKSDLVLGGKGYHLPDDLKVDEKVTTSAVLGAGIDRLRELIVKVFLGSDSLGLSSSLIPNLRHKTALESANKNAAMAIDNLKRSSPPEIIALDIKSAIESLDAITGEKTGLAIVDKIFDRFCIGK
jgi:tRNA modification GTPase